MFKGAVLNGDVTFSKINGPQSIKSWFENAKFEAGSIKGLNLLKIQKYRYSKSF